MKKLFAICALVSLAACTTPGTVTPGRSLYAAQGAYNIVLKQAVNYAESPMADQAVVLKIVKINREIAPKIKVANDIAICSAGSKKPETVAYCVAVDIGAPAVNVALLAIQGATTELATVLK